MGKILMELSVEFWGEPPKPTDDGNYDDCWADSDHSGEYGFAEMGTPLASDTKQLRRQRGRF